MNTYLNDNEKKVLASLYGLKDGSVANVAKDTLINRTTLYPILENLTVKGLVSKIKLEGKTIFQPIDSSDFEDWAKRREQEVRETNRTILEWIKNKNKKEKVSLITEVKHFEGHEGVKNLLNDTWRNNNEKLIYSLTDYEKAYDAMEKFIREEYFPARIRHGVKVKSLLPESKIGRVELKTAKEMLREMKFIKFSRDFDIEINVYDDKVALIAYDKKNPSGVLIKNEKIAEAMKNIFEYLWKKKDNISNNLVI
jgi:sugar-specific transcriptional regulator TrmB